MFIADTKSKGAESGFGHPQVCSQERLGAAAVGPREGGDASRHTSINPFYQGNPAGSSSPFGVSEGWSELSGLFPDSRELVGAPYDRVQLRL